MNDQETGKRIVSKAEYVKSKGIGLSLRVSSRGFMALAICCGCFTAWMFSYFICSIIVFFMMLCCGRNPWTMPLISLKFIMASGLSAVVFIGLAFLYHASKDRAEQIENIVLLTDANIANLPAPDILVRASSEPLQTQQAILLRAAMEPTDKQEEELLRASSGELQC